MVTSSAVKQLGACLENRTFRHKRSVHWLCKRQ